MVQAADTLKRDQFAAVIWFGVNRRSAWCVLLQRVVSTVQMVIFDILTEQPPHVFFLLRDHVVKHFPEGATDPSLHRRRVA